MRHGEGSATSVNDKRAEAEQNSIPSENDKKRAEDTRVIELFRNAIHTMRRFQIFLLAQIEADPDLDEEERYVRRADVAKTNATLDVWESNSEIHLQQGLTRDEAIALIIMAKQLQSGIEEFSV